MNQNESRVLAVVGVVGAIAGILMGDFTILAAGLSLCIAAVFSSLKEQS